MGRRHRQAPAHGGRKGYYWDGLQVPRTAVTTTNSVNVLVDTTAQEFMPATLMRIRGMLTFIPSADTVNECRAKLVYVEVNDAQTMTGDWSAIDTHEEDIAQRQLWAGQYSQPATANRTAVDLEIDVKVKLKLSAAGKHLLVLLLQAATTGRTDSLLNARCLLLHG